MWHTGTRTHTHTFSLCPPKLLDWFCYIWFVCHSDVLLCWFLVVFDWLIDFFVVDLFRFVLFVGYVLERGGWREYVSVYTSPLTRGGFLIFLRLLATFRVLQTDLKRCTNLISVTWPAKIHHVVNILVPPRFRTRTKWGPSRFQDNQDRQQAIG